MANWSLIQIARRCIKCRRHMSLRVNDDRTPFVQDGDAHVQCTNKHCGADGDPIEVDPAKAKDYLRAVS